MNVVITINNDFTFALSRSLKLISLQAKRDDCVQKKRNVPLDIGDEKDDSLQVEMNHCYVSFLF